MSSFSQCILIQNTNQLNFAVKTQIQIDHLVIQIIHIFSHRNIVVFNLENTSGASLLT